MRFHGLLLKRVLELLSFTGWTSAFARIQSECSPSTTIRSSKDADDVAAKLGKEFGVQIKVRIMLNYRVKNDIDMTRRRINAMSPMRTWWSAPSIRLTMSSDQSLASLLCVYPYFRKCDGN